MKVQTEEQEQYKAKPKLNLPITVMQHIEDDCYISEALLRLETRMEKPGEIIDSPETLLKFLRLKIAESRREHFGVVYLNAKNMYLGNETIQVGTVDQTAVYPREVVRSALMCDATSVILYHNHPSGDPAPSSQDRSLTEALKKAFALFSIKLHDHIIIGRLGYYSFAENGCI